MIDVQGQNSGFSYIIVHDGRGSNVSTRKVLYKAEILQYKKFYYVGLICIGSNTKHWSSELFKTLVKLLCFVS